MTRSTCLISNTKQFQHETKVTQSSTEREELKKQLEQGLNIHGICDIEELEEVIRSKQIEVNRLMKSPEMARPKLLARQKSLLELQGLSRINSKLEKFVEDTGAETKVEVINCSKPLVIAEIIDSAFVDYLLEEFLAIGKKRMGERHVDFNSSTEALANLSIQLMIIEFRHDDLPGTTENSQKIRIKMQNTLNIIIDLNKQSLSPGKYSSPIEIMQGCIEECLILFKLDRKKSSALNWIELPEKSQKILKIWVRILNSNFNHFFNEMTEQLHSRKFSALDENLRVIKSLFKLDVYFNHSVGSYRELHKMISHALNECISKIRSEIDILIRHPYSNYFLIAEGMASLQKAMPDYVSPSDYRSLQSQLTTAILTKANKIVAAINKLDLESTDLTRIKTDFEKNISENIADLVKASQFVQSYIIEEENKATNQSMPPYLKFILKAVVECLIHTLKGSGDYHNFVPIENKIKLIKSLISILNDIIKLDEYELMILNEMEIVNQAINARLNSIILEYQMYSFSRQDNYRLNDTYKILEDAANHDSLHQSIRQRYIDAFSNLNKAIFEKFESELSNIKLVDRAEQKKRIQELKHNLGYLINKLSVILLLELKYFIEDLQATLEEDDMYLMSPKSVSNKSGSETKQTPVSVAIQESLPPQTPVKSRLDLSTGAAGEAGTPILLFSPKTPEAPKTSGIPKVTKASKNFMWLQEYYENFSKKPEASTPKSAPKIYSRSKNS